MKRIEGNNPLICCSTTLIVKNSGFRLDYLSVVGYVGQNRDGTPGIVTSRPQYIHEAVPEKVWRLPSRSVFELFGASVFQQCV